ncbi:MAG: acetate--CoA ligase [Candidatus Diapherotrites archaeon]|nr:acetate--CoA ligase [Candidatus Diapherotrites archaeon]
MPKGSMWVVEDKKQKHVFWPNAQMKKRAWANSEKIYAEAEKDRAAFWEKKAKEGLHWFKPWSKAYEENAPYFKWFVGGEINISYNCLDRHLPAKKDKVAILWEPEPTAEKGRAITYGQLHEEVNKLANALRSLGIKKGDRVSIYLPMVPEVMAAMLACSRIGAIHNVVFSAFSGEALKARVEDSEAKVIITCDGYWRRGKEINLKEQSDIAAAMPCVQKQIVVKRLGNKVNMQGGRDYWYHELLAKEKPNCEPERMESNETLFLLYTSGTTGKPKGIIHDTGGYLTQAYWTTLWDFDLHDGDIYWCTADIGWVTGHTYACYGPLAVGATQLIYEGSPDFPDWGRIWGIIEKYKVSVFYTAPTAIRMWKKMGDDWVKKHGLGTLRLLATVGEPIDEEAWMWYFNTIGGGRCPVIDTWWQTETGGTLINALPGIGPFIPTVAGRVFPGAKADIFDDRGKPVEAEDTGFLVFKPPFPPGLLRGIWNNDEKYVETYWSEYGKNIYFTSDGAKWFDKENIRVTGRVDDVMKVAGHRLSSAEVEDAITLHSDVVESAVVPMPDEIKGQVPVVFAVLKPHAKACPECEQSIIQHVGKQIGPTARPAKVYFVDALPKTRSGKIMRRFLRGMLANEKLGDATTLQNPEVVEHLKQIVGYKAPQ